MESHPLLFRLSFNISRRYCGLMAQESQEKLRKQFFIVKSIVLDESGRILLVKRDLESWPEAHGKWELPGGKIDFGESPDQTAVREYKEETGYDVEVLSMVPLLISTGWIKSDRESHIILACYVCKRVGGEPDLSDHGVSAIDWFERTNLPGRGSCLPGTIEFIERSIDIGTGGKCDVKIQ